MNYFIFFATLIVLAGAVIFCDRKYFMLRDNSTAVPRPYSFSRVQLAWWTVIVLASFISVFISKHLAPDFPTSELYLLGISSATTIGATLIDVSDQTNPNLTELSQDMRSDNFFLDILSDKNGVNVHRFQTVVFNIVFGVWFIISVVHNLNIYSANDYEKILPVIADNNLILLGVSSGVYTALKTTENKQATANINAAPVVTDEAKAQG